MRVSLKQAESRREFFRAAARYTLLGCLSLVAGLTARRRTGSGQRCVNLGICGSCAVFAQCELPQAVSTKRARLTN
jgi:hypothetical protein